MIFQKHPLNYHFISLRMTKIYCESCNLEQLQKAIKCELKHVKERLDANKLALNVDKTNFVIIHSKPFNENITIIFYKKHVKKAKQINFFGLLLDEYLFWKHHLSR